MAIIGGVGVRDVPLEQLEARICQGAANLTAAEAVWLLDVAEFDRREGWAAWGMMSCAAWLSWHVGLDGRAAREKVRVARALVVFPIFAEAMSAGLLTYSKARAITRIANVHNAQALLDLAMASTSHQLERFVTAFRRCDVDEADADQRAFDGRSVHVSTADAVTEFVIRVPVEMGKVLSGAIHQFIADERGVPLTARRADALIELAEHAVATLDKTHTDEPRYLANLHLHPDSFDVPTPPPAPQAHEPDARNGLDALIEQLMSGRLPARGCCIGAGDGTHDLLAGIPLHSARRVLCETAIEALLTGPDGNPLRLGRLTRVATRRLKRALQLRDGGCRYPGCTHRGWLDAHHIIHWLDDGETEIDNLVLLCRFHHRFVHEQGWTLIGSPGGELSFVSPSGHLLPATPPTLTGDAAKVDEHRRTARDGHSQWAGDPMNLGYVVGVILDNQHHAASREARSAASSSGGSV